MKIYNRRLIIGITLFVVIILYSLVSTIFYEGDTSEWYLVQKNLKPSSDFILGSTGLGQEIFYLLSDSILYSLIIGISVAMFSTLIGVIVGSISGFVGGLVDKLLIFFMDAIIAIPSLPILILLASLFKGDFTLFIVCIVLVLFNWPWPARQARAMALSIKENDFSWSRAAWNRYQTLFWLDGYLLYVYQNMFCSKVCFEHFGRSRSFGVGSL